MGDGLAILHTLCSIMKILTAGTLWPVVATYADNALDEVKKTAALNSGTIPLGNTLYTPLVLQTAMAYIYCVWGIASVLSLSHNSRMKAILWTIPELIFSGIFLTCVIMESRVLPNPGSCTNAQDSKIFKAIAIANPSDTTTVFTAYDACHDFRQAWQTAIVATSLCVIPLSIGSGRIYYGDSTGPSNSMLVKSFLWIFGAISCCIRVFFGPFIFFLFLSTRALSSTIRIVSKYSPNRLKTKLTRSPTSFELHTRRENKPSSARRPVPLAEVLVQPIPGTSPFEQLLAIDDMFLSIVEFTCAADLHRLRASRTLNSIIQRHMSQSRRALQRTVCGGTRDTCLCCMTPICNACTTRRRLRSSNRLFRQKNLDPVCSLCYVKSLCFKQNHFLNMLQSCRCTAQRTEHRLCSHCAPLNENVLLAKRDRLERKRPEAKDVEGSMVCFLCRKSIWKWSLRSWRCRICRLEYRRGPLVGKRLL